MKKAELSKTRAYNESDDDTDCMCEVLCADDLSKVGSSDCSCSDCAEAMLEAYNEYLAQAGKPRKGKETQRNKGDNKGRGMTQTRQKSQEDSRKQTINRNKSTFNRSPRFQTTNTRNQAQIDTCYRHTRQKHKSRQHKHKSLEQQQDPDDYQDYQPQTINIQPTKYDFSEAQMQYYVNERIKQNLKKHKHRQRDEKKLKQYENQKKKLALLKLKQKARQIIDNNEHKEVPKKPWNYQGQDQKQEQKEKEQQHCHKIPIKGQTNSGMDRNVVEQIVKQRLKQKKQKQKVERQQAKARMKAEAQGVKLEQKPDKCKYDDCNKHHMNTSPRTINKITQKIEKNAQKVLQKMKNDKKQKQDAIKLKQSKLRALALNAKQKVQKSKKVGLNDRSSFHLTIQQFSTFSDLKKVQLQKQQQQKFQKQLQQQINPNTKKKQQIIGGNQISEIEQQLDDQIRKPKGFSKQKSINQSKSKEKSNINMSKSQSSEFSKLPSKVTKQIKESTLKSIEKSLNKNIKAKPLQEQIEDAIADPNSKFYVWDMPLGDAQVKKIFDEAKIPAPRKSKNVSEQKTNKGQTVSEFRDEVNKKIEQNIKKKLKQKDIEKKQNAIDQRVRLKKQQIIRQYQKIKDLQTLPQKSATSSQNVTKPKNNPKSNKQLKSQFQNKIKQNNSKKPKGNHEKQPHIKQDSYGIDLSQQSSSYQKSYENKATGSLQENQIFSQGDKKIFVLNSEMLTGVKHLKV